MRRASARKVGSSSTTSTRPSGGRLAEPVGERQPQRGRGADVEPALQRQRAAEQLGQPARVGQAQPGALGPDLQPARAPGRTPRRSGSVLGGDADAGVGDA